jgi:hypothetical protein
LAQANRPKNPALLRGLLASELVKVPATAKLPASIDLDFLIDETTSFVCSQVWVL